MAMRSDRVKISPFVRDAAREGTTFATVDIPALLSNARAQHASTGTDIGMSLSRRIKCCLMQPQEAHPCLCIGLLLDMSPETAVLLQQLLLSVLYSNMVCAIQMQSSIQRVQLCKLLTEMVQDELLSILPSVCRSLHDI